jgi:hypothetical protein
LEAPGGEQIDGYSLDQFALQAATPGPIDTNRLSVRP